MASKLSRYVVVKAAKAPLLVALVCLQWLRWVRSYHASCLGDSYKVVTRPLTGQEAGTSVLGGIVWLGVVWLRVRVTSPLPLVGGDLGWHKVFRFRRWEISRFFFHSLWPGRGSHCERGLGRRRGTWKTLYQCCDDFNNINNNSYNNNNNNKLKVRTPFWTKKFKNFQGLHSMF